MKITTKKHPDTRLTEVFINNKKAGFIDDVEGLLCYVPASAYALTPNMINGIGKLLNELNEANAPTKCPNTIDAFGGSDAT